MPTSSRRPWQRDHLESNLGSGSIPGSTSTVSSRSPTLIPDRKHDQRAEAHDPTHPLPEQTALFPFDALLVLATAIFLILRAAQVRHRFLLSSAHSPSLCGGQENASHQSAITRAPCSRIIWFVDARIGKLEMAVFLTSQAPPARRVCGHHGATRGDRGDRGQRRCRPVAPVAPRSPLTAQSAKVPWNTSRWPLVRTMLK